ncbi:MAG: hypothetical protein H6Q38_1451 [Chloroflexi bacterium]|nr:hypothetical protein [Chloroflexota bacterium]
MNKKRVFVDGFAIAGALAVLAVTTLLLPSFWPIWLRLLIGALIASILFAIYLVARPPDEIIALEQQLETIAINAKQIMQAGKELIPEAKTFRQSLADVSTAIAQLEVKIMQRELITLGTPIRRLESLSKNFLMLTKVLTGEVYLRPAELSQKLSEIREQHIPETLETIQELNASLDESRAKQLVSAEEELELLSALYDRDSAAHNAAEILRQVLEESLKTEEGGPHVT